MISKLDGLGVRLSEHEKGSGERLHQVYLSELSQLYQDHSKGRIVSFIFISPWASIVVGTKLATAPLSADIFGGG